MCHSFFVLHLYCKSINQREGDKVSGKIKATKFVQQKRDEHQKLNLVQIKNILIHLIQSCKLKIRAKNIPRKTCVLLFDDIVMR